MRGKYRPHHILEVVLLFIALAGFSASNSKANENSKYLNAVREFADNVLKYGRDTYGPKHTPLFVDGLNIHTHEPVKWIAPNGDRWILSNLASQQNLFRTLDGLTKITGDPKYRQAAMEAIRYAFDNLRSPNGLLYWGNATVYDAQRDKVFGWHVGDPYNHCLKANLPYYEMMWQVNPEETKRFIEAFWSTHIHDWSNLDMNRWAYYGIVKEPLGRVWRHEYKEGPVFLGASKGGSFFSAATDMIYTAALLTKLSGDKDPLVWAKRMVHRYVRTRHPKTGISYMMYKKPKVQISQSSDDIRKKLVPGTSDFLTTQFPWSQYTNRIHREMTLGEFMPTPGTFIHKHIFYWQAQFLVGDMLITEGEEFKQWALEELTAIGKASYRREDNVFVPILTDGTKIEGYVVKEDGPFGPKGVALESVPAGPSDLWAYTMGYRVARDDFMWEMAHSIAKGNEFGDIGATPNSRPQLKTYTECSDPYALLAFLELYRTTGKKAFLEMAKRIGDNILRSRFYKGFFVASNKHIYTKFDAVDSLALLQLYSTLFGDTGVRPQAWPSLPYFVCPYRNKELGIDNKILYSLTESFEPPVSLQEAAAIGDVNLVKNLVENGTDVDSLVDCSFKTALCRAAMGGYKDVVELLLAKGADVNAGNLREGTALHYAAGRGDNQIVKLLIAKGADVNARNTDGKTPVDIALQGRRWDIVRALIDAGADITQANAEGQTLLHIVTRRNQKDLVKILLDKGSDVNAGDNKGQTPLHIAAERGQREIIELLLARGARIDAKDQEGATPALAALYGWFLPTTDMLLEKGADAAGPHLAAYTGNLSRIRELLDTNSAGDDYKGLTLLHAAAAGGQLELVNYLIGKGFDVKASTESELTPLHYAVMGNHQAVAEILIAQGAPIDERQTNLLAVAAWVGHKGMAQYLISKGADINKGPETPLHQAVSWWKLDMAKLLLELGADIDARDEEGNTSLHWAVNEWYTAMANYLISKGADVDARNKQGRTPLHEAAAGWNTPMAKLLIENGASVNIKDNNGQTPFALVKERPDTMIAKLLRKYEAKEEETSVSPPADINKKAYAYQMPLHKAAAEADLVRVKFLISGGAEVNAESNEGWTALHRAVVFGHTDVVKLLLVHGAKVNTVNRWGWTPLHSAALYGHKAVVELLLANGADISAKTPEGGIPLQIAIERGYKEVAELLRKPGAKEGKAPQGASKE